MRIPARKIVIVSIGLSVAFIIGCIPFVDFNIGDVDKMLIGGAMTLLANYIGAGGVKDGNKKQGEQ